MVFDFVDLVFLALDDVALDADTVFAFDFADWVAFGVLALVLNVVTLLDDDGEGVMLFCALCEAAVDD